MQAELETQLTSLREVVASHMVAGGEAVPSACAAVASAEAAAPKAAPQVEVGCQAGRALSDADGDVAQRLAMERWQQQLSAMSEWLRTGAQLLNANAPGGMPPGGLGGPPSGLALGPLVGSRPLSTAASEASEGMAAERLSGSESAALDEPSSVC